MSNKALIFKLRFFIDDLTGLSGEFSSHYISCYGNKNVRPDFKYCKRVIKLLCCKMHVHDKYHYSSIVVVYLPRGMLHVLCYSNEPEVY